MVGQSSLRYFFIILFCLLIANLLFASPVAGFLGTQKALDDLVLEGDKYILENSKLPVYDYKVKKAIDNLDKIQEKFISSLKWSKEYCSLDVVQPLRHRVFYEIAELAQLHCSGGVIGDKLELVVMAWHSWYSPLKDFHQNLIGSEWNSWQRLYPDSKMEKLVNQIGAAIVSVYEPSDFGSVVADEAIRRYLINLTSQGSKNSSVYISERAKRFLEERREFYEGHYGLIHSFSYLKTSCEKNVCQAQFQLRLQLSESGQYFITDQVKWVVHLMPDPTPGAHKINLGVKLVVLD